jgi:hypothetical protein
MFQNNVEFRVTIRDFQDRTEAHVLKQAGALFVRAIREASAEYLENCFKEEGVVDIDHDLRWNVTLHHNLGIGTIHYAIYREGVGFEGKCLVYDLEKGPVPNRPWVPIVMKAGELGSNIIPTDREFDSNYLYTEHLKGVCQPVCQNFFEYFFRGWIPVTRITADMVEENMIHTLIGAGYSKDLVLGTPDYPEGLVRMLSGLHALHNSVVKNHNLQNQYDDDRKVLAGREYEFDFRHANNTIVLKVNYLTINPVNRPADVPLQDTNFQTVFQEGGWLDGAFAKLPSWPQFTALDTFFDRVEFDDL